MIEILAKYLIENKEDVANPKVRKGYGSLCSIVGILFNLILFGIKYIAGTISGSIAIVADSFNSLSDAGSSIIMLFGFRLAGKKPDSDHPFGHGRMEYLSGLAVSFLILLMGVELLKSAVDKIIHPAMVEGNSLVLAILVVSILVKCYMAYYNRKIGKRINSAAMKATSTDSLSDAASTGAVLITTLLSEYTSLNLDGWCGLLVAVLVLRAGIEAVKETIDPLLGLAPEKEFVDRIEEIVMDSNVTCGLHDLIVHDYGPGRVMISLHAEVPGNGDIYEIHDAIDLLENRLKDELGCDATIHMDPIATNDERTMELKQMVYGIVKGIDETLSIHDFRIVAGPTHTNLVFDLLLPAGYKKKEEDITNEIKQQVCKENETYFCVIKVDQDYVNR